jgi:glycosidase
MVKAAHRRHLKVVLDMELQYVASEHPWYVAAQRDPSSPEGKCLLPQSGFMGQRAVPSYDGSRVPIATVNTNNPEVLKTWEASFLYWAAPTGRPQDGVDGFRLDHMMDDLDNRHTNANMFERVWKPLEAEVRRAKPGTFFLAEQSDWGLGGAVFQQGGVDAAYAIPMYLALKSLDAAKLAQGIKDELAATPEGKTQFVFVEDHDVERYASVVQSDPKLLRLGAVFMLTSKGTPSIYYGQELGMKGIQLHGHSDGNDIPVRLAFRWSRQIDAPGTATWYGQGPWNDPSLSRSGDGISLEEERPDPDSLYSFYRKLIALRRHDKALTDGDERLLDGLPSGVVGFVRTQGQEQVKVLLNLGSAPASVNLSGVAFRDLLTGKPSGSVVDLQGHDFRILQSHVRT